MRACTTSKKNVCRCCSLEQVVSQYEGVTGGMKVVTEVTEGLKRKNLLIRPKSCSTSSDRHHDMSIICFHAMARSMLPCLWALWSSITAIWHLQLRSGILLTVSWHLRLGSGACS